MKHLELLGFNNYRIFSKDTNLQLKQITLLTGPNSSGKSSVVKALKLLKQNCPKGKHEGLPTDLGFTKDDYGHYLGSYNKILSRNNKQKENISFSLPLELDTLGDKYYIELTYGPLKSNKNRITLLQYSVFSFIGNKKNRLFTLEGGLDNFYYLKIDFLHFKNALESVFLPILNFSKLDAFSNNIKDILKVSRNNHLLQKGLINEFTSEIEEYNSAKPILPFYEVLYNGQIDPHEMEYNELEEMTAQLEYLRKFYAKEIEEYKIVKRISDEKAIYQYFKEKEKSIFKYIYIKDLQLPGLDFSTKDRNFFWWDGFHINSLIDEEDISDALKSLEDFDNNYIKLMSCYACSHLNYKDYPNYNIFFEYIKYIIMQSIEVTRELITKLFFFDSNRIEQSYFYHYSNAKIAYNLLNDYHLKASGRSGSDIKINEILQKLNIAEAFELIATDSGTYEVKLIENNSKMPLVEYGFGITKLFFLLVALHTYDLVFIEEPESNLHPDLQSKLADIIVDILDSNKQIVIETHSEYLIRKMQYLIATNKLDKDKIIVNYFNQSQDRKKQGLIRVIKFLKDGSLDREFGTGFFDEVAKTIEDIYRQTDMV